MSDIFGKKLGQYVLLEQLGEGGMAKVYNALDERVERNVAIKVILPNKRSSQIFLQQFEREAKALANLTHTNIVKVLNYGTEDGQPYLVMEYIQGGTLKDAITGKLPWQKAAEILAPIARALDYVHHQNIVHQDIKPSNILLDEEFRPMLSDFGVVKLLEAKEGENAAIGVGVGTPDYMSPEQGMGQDVDFRADIYSLGVVFYEMVIGEKPFIADTPMAVVIKHVTEEIPLPRKKNKNIPIFVEKVILRAVQKNPEDRFDNMGQFADVLELIALGNKAPSKKILSLTKKDSKKQFALSRVLSGVLLTLLAIAGISSLLIWENPDNYDRIISMIRKTPYSNVPPTATSVPQISSKPPAILSSQPTFTEMLSSQPTAIPAGLAGSSPTPSGTQAPTQVQTSSLTLLGVPISPSGNPHFTEIARWGIGGVNKVKWSPNGDTIALGTTSGIFLYDSKTKEMKRFINTGFNAIELTFSPDGSVLLAGSLNGQIKLYSSQTGLEIKLNISISEKSAVTKISFSKNEKNVVIGFKDGNLYLVSLEQNKVTHTRNQYPTIEDAFTSDDERFLYFCNGESKFFVWDISADKISEIKSPIPVDKMVPSPNRQSMVSAGTSNVAYYWDLTAGEPKIINGFPNLGASVTAIDFSPDGNLIAIGLDNGEIKIFAKPDIKSYSKSPEVVITIPASVHKIQAVSFFPSPTQLLIATATWEEGLNIWDAKTGENVYTAHESMMGINRIEFSPNAAWLATAHEGHVVRVWDVQAAREAYQFEGYLPKGLPFSPNSQYLTVIKNTRNTWDVAPIQIVELSTGKVVKELRGYELNSFLQFSDDTKMLVTGTAQKVTIWDVSTWEKINVHGEVTAGCGQFFTPENKMLAVVTSVGILFTYEGNDPKICGKPPLGTTFVYYFKKQNRVVYVLGNGKIWTWDFYSEDISNIAPLPTYLNPRDIFLAANQDSGWFASVSDETLFVKNISNNLNGTIPGQDDYDYQVAFLPAQKLFALGSRYGSIHIWTLP